MWLWLAIAIALVSGVLSAFGGRLQATGLWAGKVLTPPESATDLPRGLQDALTDGWPSTLGMISGLLPFAAGVLGFIHAWWAAILAFLVAMIASSVFQRSQVAPSNVDRYLLLLLGHAQRRHANFLARGDHLRASAAADLSEQLEALYFKYRGTGVPAPTIQMAQAAPFGEPDSLFAHSLMNRP